MHSTRVTIASALARRRVRRRACIKRKAIRELVCKYYLCEEQEEEKGGHQDSKQKEFLRIRRELQPSMALGTLEKISKVALTKLYYNK